MAITWGAAVTGGTGGMKLGYEVSRSGATMTVKIYVNTKYAVDDDSNTFVVSITGATDYNGSVSVKTTSNLGGWSDTNTKLLGTFTTTYAGTVSISASLTGINTLGTSLKATLSASVVNYTKVTSGSISSVVDNGNNTLTISGYCGSDGTNNAITACTLYYIFSTQSSNQSIALGTSSGAWFSKTISIPAGATLFSYYIATWGRVGDASTSSKSTSVKYYSDPGYPGTPVLSYRRKGPTLRETLTFSWAAASGGTNVPVKGYRLRLYKNGWLLTGINPSDSSASHWDTGSTGTTFTFDPAKFGFKVGDTVKLGIYSYGYNGAGSQLFNGGGSGAAQVNSIEYTFINAGIVHLKVGGVWKEGQVYVKVNGVWKEADSIYIKKDGSWKESL